MATWTREEVLGLASGTDGPRSVARLAGSGGWSATGVRTGPGAPPATARDPATAAGDGSSDGAVDAVWGSCQGSARTPYACVVSLERPLAASCTCPSRRSPCKHALALLLRQLDGAVGSAPPSEAARRWLAARSDLEPTRTAAAAPIDPVAAARRAAARVERVNTGLDELSQWLHDQVRGGLAGLERGGEAEIERVAARLVDAQAPGAAAMLRAVQADLRSGDWPARVLDALAGLHLLVEAHRRLAALPPALAVTVRSRVGYPTSKAEVLAGPGVSDQWTGLGQVDTVENRLESRRVWLWGARTRRWALYLSYAPPGMELDASVLAGTRLDAVLHFYPGSGSFRALVGAPAPEPAGPGPAAPERAAPDPESTGSPPGAAAGPPGRTVAEERQRFAALLAEDPWASRMPSVVAGLPLAPRRAGEGWALVDGAGEAVPLVGLAGDPWPLVAYAGSGPVSVFGEWTPVGLRPLSLLADPDDTRVFTTDLLGRAA